MLGKTLFLASLVLGSAGYMTAQQATPPPAPPAAANSNQPIQFQSRRTWNTEPKEMNGFCLISTDPPGQLPSLDQPS